MFSSDTQDEAERRERDRIAEHVLVKRDAMWREGGYVPAYIHGYVDALERLWLDLTGEAKAPSRPEPRWR